METAIDEELTELNAIIGWKPYKDVAYFIMKQYIETEDPPENTKRNFYEWLSSPCNTGAKEEAMARCFEDMFA